MVIKLFKFGKRQNSTAQPVETGSNPTPSLPEISNAKINDGDSSVTNPVIRIPERASGDQVDLTQYNYVKIPKWGRYYHIENWNYNGDGTWSAYCNVDVLASWKTNILASGGYVQRSYTSMETSDVADPLYPATNTFVTARRTGTTGLQGDPARGTFVVGILSSDAPNIGSVSYFIIPPAQMAILVSTLMMTHSGDAWADITLQSETAAKSIIDPLQYVVSCKWFPFTVSGLTYTTTISFGSWTTTARGYKLPVSTSFYYTSAVILSSSHETVTYTDNVGTQNMGDWSYLLLPKIEEEATDGYYPLYENFASCSLITPWGVFDMPVPIIRNLNQHNTSNGGKLYYRLRTDFISGEATFWVMAQPYKGTSLGNPVILLKRNIMLAKDIPLTQVTINNVGFTQSALGAAGSVVSTGLATSASDAVGGVLGLAKNIIQCGVEAMKPSVKSTSNGTTSINAEIESIAYEEIRHRTIPVSKELTGTLRKAYTSSLSGFSGYVQMDVTTFAAPCTGTEKDEIIRWLTSGVYIE